nr:MAG TPA: hypothetical protein [Caudoviricetes sp.]DAZ46028.1 MAG TPA: hypothetical protein [Caudoviricetes sp.]
MSFRGVDACIDSLFLNKSRWRLLPEMVLVPSLGLTD